MPNQDVTHTVTPIETINASNDAGSQTKKTDIPARLNKKVLMIFTILLLCLIVFVSLFLFGILAYDKGQTELLMGLLIVTSIIALMTLLYVMAAGFSFMGLTDSTKPLGLPEGSIRAMIALILIMVFIIFGIFTFKSTSNSFEVALFKNIDNSKLNSIDLSVYDEGNIKIQKNDKDSSKYDVIYANKPSEESSRLAQQLLTTVGTLVVAIASFYFGSATVNSAITTAKSINPTTTTTTTPTTTTTTTGQIPDVPQTPPSKDKTSPDESTEEDEGADPIEPDNQKDVETEADGATSST